MFDDVLIIFIGALVSALGFLIMHWISRVDNSIAELDARIATLEKKMDTVLFDVKHLKEHSVSTITFQNHANQLSQRLNREHSRISNIEDMIKETKEKTNNTRMRRITT